MYAITTINNYNFCVIYIFLAFLKLCSTEMATLLLPDTFKVGPNHIIMGTPILFFKWQAISQLKVVDKCCIYKN